jgi:hypothetical protein
VDLAAAPVLEHQDRRRDGTVTAQECLEPGADGPILGTSEVDVFLVCLKHLVHHLPDLGQGKETRGQRV